MDDKKKRKKMRYSDDELALMKNVFSDNDGLINAMRKLFYQLPMDKTNKSFITSTFSGNKGLQDLVRKVFLPEIDATLPLHDAGDLWFWLPINIVEKTEEQAIPIIRARAIFIDYISQQIEILCGKGKETLTLHKLTPTSTSPMTLAYSNLLARNWIINHVETQCVLFTTLAGMKTETVEETLARLKKDSTK